MKTITTLLIANRGEIAVRVARTARAMGLRVVAVYSDADANALHVRVADIAVRIGPANVSESYLNADAILEAARQTGADAIHPGYGFLSENQAFAEACEQAGIIFVGPPNEAIDIMGDKARAKRAMIAAGVPCIPGYQDDDQSLETLSRAAVNVGLPVMVKAAAGGGGRGMRLVTDISELASAIEMAQSEALNAFGSSELIIEKAVLRPRHVEIQVFADQHGNVIHLGERDCSIQRRHQKVIEEAPCPVMTPSLREAMGHAAVEAARAVNYVGAGTVEFLLDEGGAFYFLEMNTRLQVEHPVTELVTGFDLVEWQLRVARGERLSIQQEDVMLLGHAIEVRLYAEDPASGFLPSTGKVNLWHVPQRVGLRIDGGVETGDEISPFYDPMVAKIIAFGDTREDARNILLAALKTSALLGVSNNRDFLIDALQQTDFVNGTATTAFIADHYGDQFSAELQPLEALSAAAVLQHKLAQMHYGAATLGVSHELVDWSSDARHQEVYGYDWGEQSLKLVLSVQAHNEYSVAVDGEQTRVSVVSMADNTAHLVVGDKHVPVVFQPEGLATLYLATESKTLYVTNEAMLPPDTQDQAGSGSLVAPMHGQLLSVLVKEGQVVEKGDRLAVLEAMKMQHELVAQVDGVVSHVWATAGSQLAAGDRILMVESEP